MSGRVILRPSAFDDLESISAYLARDSEETADRFLDACRSDSQNLADMPGMGTLRELNNLKAAGIRSWPVSRFRSYLIFYRPIEGGVEILQIMHGARNIDFFFESL